MIVAKLLLLGLLIVSTTAAFLKPNDTKNAPRQSYRGQVGKIESHFKWFIWKLFNNQTFYSLVFLGDSITDFWKQNGWQPWAEFYEPLGAVNTGVAGDLTTSTIDRITNNGIIDNLNSRLAVLLIGTILGFIYYH